MNFGNLFKQDYMTVFLQTVVLLIWLLMLFPMLIGYFGYGFNTTDPIILFAAVFSGLIVSGMTFKLLKYRR